MRDVLEISNALIDICNKKKITLTPAKLQLLTYLAQGYWLAMTRSELFFNEIKAFDNGILIERLWQAFPENVKPYSPIVSRLGDKTALEADAFEYELLESIAEIYGKMNTEDIHSIVTAAGSPYQRVWAETKRSAIPSAMIREHYLAIFATTEALEKINREKAQNREIH